MRLFSAVVFLALTASAAFLVVGLMNPDFEYQTDVFVAAPVEETFAVFTDEDRLGVWLSGLVSIQYLRGEPGAVGSFYRLTFDENGRQIVLTKELTGLRDNELSSASLDGQMMRADVSSRFSVEGNGTRIVTTNVVRPKGLVYRTLMWLSRGELQDRQQADFERFRLLVQTN